MWRNLKFLHMWINFTFLHMTDVEKSEISFIMCTIYGILLHFTLFWCRICLFLRFTLFCRKIGLLRFTRYCVEKILAKNSARGEKMTNTRYGVPMVGNARKMMMQRCSSHSSLGGWLGNLTKFSRREWWQSPIIHHTSRLSARALTQSYINTILH